MDKQRFIENGAGGGTIAKELSDLNPRMDKYIIENSVHFEREENINQNNRLFKKGCEALGWHVDQIPLAESNGVVVIPNCRVDKIEGNDILATITEGKNDTQNDSFLSGKYRICAKKIVLCTDAINTPAILMRSFGKRFNPVIGRYLTVHPALIIAADHDEVVNGMQGPAKNYYCDQFVESDRFLLESCMYFPFSFSKNLVGFGSEPDELIQRYPNLQMALILALDDAHKHNRVTIDKRGEPVVHYKIDKKLQGTFIKALKACAELVFSSGAKRAHLPGTEKFFITPKDLDDIDSVIQKRNFKLGQVAINSAHLMGGVKWATTKAIPSPIVGGRSTGLTTFMLQTPVCFPAVPR